MSWDSILEARLRAHYGVESHTEAAKFYSAEARRKLAASGHAMADGSFPIEDRQDVRNAIRLARTPAQRRHIMRRARALGCAELIPDHWMRDAARVVPLKEGFLTEHAGRMVLTAPARTVTGADQLPQSMAERWERAADANPYYLWVAGRFVEAEKANRNGAFWATEDLQFGEMSVRHGPLNWLHQPRTVIGTIADNQLIHPVAARDAAAVERPYIAAVSAIWKWVYPDQAAAVQTASDAGQLWYSMECVARQLACHSDGERTGCGQQFDYLTAMVEPESVCEHVRNRSCARRMVDPSFLGGAVILPPVHPGWAEANASVLHRASALAEQVAPREAAATEWETLMACVLDYLGA